jgi:restriction system protein
MARRRGFFAEMQHQARLSEQRQRAAMRQHEAHVRSLERARKASARAQATADRASEADRKRLEKEAAAAHVEFMQVRVEHMNDDLAAQYAELDGLLTATLDRDDHVDLEELRVIAEHPPFPRPELRDPIPYPAPIPDPPLPIQHEPEPPTGLFGKKRKLEEARAAVDAQYATDYYAWQAATEALPGLRAEQRAEHVAAEEARQRRLAEVEADHALVVAEVEADAAAKNDELDALISGLAYGTVDAVEEYIGIVLANSVYPEWFEVSHRAEFDPATAELDLRVTIPGPDLIPAIKAYRYVKASDEISPSPSTQKDTRDRYAKAVHDVALRSLHEVFEADRRGLIRGISLELGTDTINPATGRDIYVRFVAVATPRERFAELDLSAVVPSATLTYLNAVVSKNPSALIGVEADGVRRA